MVILPDVRGLSRFYEELALRFAERGIAAVAIDYFGRTAGTEKRGDDFEYMEHVAQTTPEGVQADVAAAVEWLRQAGSSSIFTVGCCFGGRNSWLSAAGGHGLAGAVGFYGQPGQRESPGPTQRAGEIDAPILALQAGDDEKITAEDNKEFDEALTAAGVEHEVVTYPGRRTASSTAATRSSRTIPPTPGSGCSASSSATAPSGRLVRGRTDRRRSPARRGRRRGPAAPDPT